MNAKEIEYGRKQSAELQLLLLRLLWRRLAAFAASYFKHRRFPSFRKF